MAPDRREKSKLGQVITIVTSIAAIATAFAGWYEGRAMEEQQTEVSRESYNVLAASVRELAEENKQRHEEIAHLKGFIEGFIKLQLLDEGGFEEADSFDPEPPFEPSPVVIEERISESAPPPPPRVATARKKPSMAKKPRMVDPPSYDQIQQKAF